MDAIGYRRSVVISEIASGLGLAGLAVLPDLFPDPFTGIMLCVIIYAVGSGLIEVVGSPIVEACPFEHKDAVMSMLHSFYCWGHVGVVLLSTLFFRVFGIANWRILAIVWAMIPLFNLFVFTRVPIAPLLKEGETGMKIRELFGRRLFWILFLMMICSGASEQSVSQWASTFAEKGSAFPKPSEILRGRWLSPF